MLIILKHDKNSSTKYIIEILFMFKCMKKNKRDEHAQHTHTQ